MPKLPKLMQKILLVEDQEDIRLSLATRLKNRGYDVVVAADGAEGVAQALKEIPDLILMDLELPEIDGWEATRRLKAQTTTQHIPIIALTAHAQSGDRQKALAAGCDDHDIKPIEFPRLLNKIKRLLDGEK